MKYLIAAIIVIVLMISGVMYIAKSTPPMGVHIEVYGGVPTKETWIFKCPILGSFTDYYARGLGFQDQSYYYAFSGNVNDIEQWLSAITTELVSEKDDPQKGINALLEGLSAADPDYAKHGWDLSANKVTRWWSNKGGNCVLFYLESDHRIYYAFWSI